MLPRRSLYARVSVGRRLYPAPLGPATATLHRLDHYTLVKIGYAPFILCEAEAIDFVRRRTSIPVPRVLDVWDDDDKAKERAYLVMEFLDGENLDRAWPKMTDGQRANVVAQLRACIAELRSLPQPNRGWIGSCSRGPAMDHRIQTETGTFGPLPSVSAFHDFLLRKFKKHMATHYAHYRSMYTDDHAVVFSHADLGPKNILVDAEEGRLVAIIDWEMAGWWPAYWEFRKAVYGEDRTAYCRLWRTILPVILEPYEKEKDVDTRREYM